MAAETKYTANTGLVQFAAANTSLSAGTIGVDIFTVITGASNGTLIKSVTIKSTGSPLQGMIRLWIYDGTSKVLFQQIQVDPIKQSSTDPSFSKTIMLDFVLKSGYSLLASSQTADRFNVIAEGLDIAYFTAFVRPESTNYVVNIGTASIATGNSSLTTGTIGTDIFPLITAASNGTVIESIHIKATAATTADGMVRIFVYDGTSFFLFTEVFVPYTAQSGMYQSFEHVITFPEKFQLRSGYSFYVTTERSDSFHVVAQGLDWSYPANPNNLTNYNTVSISASTTETLLRSYQIPAGLFQTGDLIKVYCEMAVNNNSHNKTLRIYVNTSNSLSGATQIASYTSAFVAGDNMERMFPVLSDTSLECYGGTTLGWPNTRNEYATTTGTSAAITVPSVSAGFWILISGQNASSLDTTTLRWSVIEKLY